MLTLGYLLLKLLFRCICLPSLLNGVEACPVNQSVTRSLEYVINNTFKKIFDTKSCDIANESVIMFNCSVNDTVHRRKSKFLNKLPYNENTLSKMFRNNMQVEITELSVSHCS